MSVKTDYSPQHTEDEFSDYVSNNSFDDYDQEIANLENELNDNLTISNDSVEIKNFAREYERRRNTENQSQSPSRSSPQSSSKPISSSVVSYQSSPLLSSKSSSSPIQSNNGQSSDKINLKKLFSKLNENLKLVDSVIIQPTSTPPTSTDQKANMNNNLTSNNLTPTTNAPLKPKPVQLPELCFTNTKEICYDCDHPLDYNDPKGAGFGYLGIDLYFCRICYMNRFQEGEGKIINFRENEDEDLMIHLRDEFFYILDADFDKCFSCNDKNLTMIYRCKGIIEGSELIICEPCGHKFHEKIKYLRQVLTQHDMKVIRDEKAYYLQRMILKKKYNLIDKFNKL